MPKSKRRKPRRPAHRSSQARWDSTRAELFTWLPLLQATDEAERHGDAARAVQLIASRPLDRRGELFWRPDRMGRLSQIARWGPLLPRWATSRWILAQAAQFLAPEVRAGHQFAATLATQRRGVPDAVRARQAESADLDLLVEVVDHDWAYRQLLLYDLGGLHGFLRHGATPELLAGADHIEDWAEAPMGGYRFVSQDAATVQWVDLATGGDVITPNIGSAALLLTDDCVIGRLVPIEGGEMFESVPLIVPDEVAELVAACPAAWSEIVADHASADVPEERRVMTGGHEFALLTDIPAIVQLIAARSVAEEAADPVACRAGLVIAALDGFVPDDPDAVRIEPLVSASLVDPLVLEELARCLSPSRKRRLAAYAERLPAPCADLCRLLVDGQAMAS